MTRLAQVAGALRQVDRQYRIDRGANGWFLIDNSTGRGVACGSEYHCREALCELMAEAVLATLDAPTEKP